MHAHVKVQFISNICPLSITHALFLSYSLYLSPLSLPLHVLNSLPLSLSLSIPPSFFVKISFSLINFSFCIFNCDKVSHYIQRRLDRPGVNFVKAKRWTRSILLSMGYFYSSKKDLRVYIQWAFIYRPYLCFDQRDRI